MRIVRVTARLDSAHIVEEPLHLDALLAAVHPAQHGLERVTRAGGVPAVAPLPLAQVKWEADAATTWVWLCSAQEYPGEAHVRNATIIKRRDAADMHYAARTYQPASGAFRDRVVTRQAVGSAEVVWYAGLVEGREGRLANLRHLLQRVGQIGGLRKCGYGAVRDWLVEEIAEDWRFVVQDADGCARRNLPVWFAEESPKKAMSYPFVPVRPPYWHPANLAPGIPAGTPFRLRETGIEVD